VKYQAPCDSNKFPQTALLTEEATIQQVWRAERLRELVELQALADPTEAHGVEHPPSRLEALRGLLAPLLALIDF
jgi:hypothetical protein